MTDELIDIATKLGMTLGRLPGRVCDKGKKDEVEKRIRNSLYPIRNSQNAASLMKALSDAQQTVGKLSGKEILFSPYNQDNKPVKESLWIDANLLSYLALPNCEWEKIKHLIVIAATNQLGNYRKKQDQQD